MGKWNPEDVIALACVIGIFAMMISLVIAGIVVS